MRFTGRLQWLCRPKVNFKCWLKINCHIWYLSLPYFLFTLPRPARRTLSFPNAFHILNRKSKLHIARVPFVALVSVLIPKAKGPCSIAGNISICNACSNSGVVGHGMVGFRARTIYRDEQNLWVKGSVRVLFWNLHHRGERGRKGRECKFQNKLAPQVQESRYLWCQRFCACFVLKMAF